MTRQHKAWLAAGLLAGAAALTGCSAGMLPSAASTPGTQAQVTAQPDAQRATASPGQSPQAEETEKPLALRVDGKDITGGAFMEEDMLLLPLEETAKALGWSYELEEKEEESAIKRSVSLQRDESQITISWSVSDNTAKGITWQKDGLLIPVDTQLTTMDNRIYVPAAFFETAMDAVVDRQPDRVVIAAPTPEKTPDNDAQNTDGNLGKDNN